MKYKLTLAYDGTRYGGWQAQTNTTAIQTLIEQSLKTALRQNTPLIGASRTDAGVHALAQVAHFSFEKRIDPLRLRASLNGLLPPDIRIREIEPVDIDFHARYSALSKEYHYHLHLDRVINPFKRLYTTPVYHPVDIPFLTKAAQNFIGTHNFTSFTNEAHQDSTARHPIRTISRLDVVLEPGGVRLEFEGNGFLYKMVRNITGTLLDITAGKISLSDLPKIFAEKDRKKAGKTAPAQGLFLIKIRYEKFNIN